MRLVMFLLLLSFCLPVSVICAPQSPQAAPPAQHKAGDVVIEEAEAPAPGTGQKVPVDFGTLYVPENRGRPSGKLIEIVFLRFKSTSKTPGPPVIYLEGGPGISGINSALGNLFNLFMALRETGDVIVLDQRGSGRSNRLTCPGSTQEMLGASLTHDGLLRQVETESRRCVQALKAKGIDLSAYNTNENADDVDALRSALNAPQANLLAYSYGTHLAMAVIRRHPNHFRRAVMIGTTGPDHLQKLPSGIEHQVIEIDRLARADANLHQKIPSLIGLMRSVLTRLETQPVNVEITDPKSRQKIKISVDKFGLQWLTAVFISRRDFIEIIPALYYGLSKDDSTILTTLLQKLAQSVALPATQYTMRCASGASKQRLARVERETKTALLGNAMNFPWPEICGVWEVPNLGDAFRAPVRSGMPVLFISGSLDANAPPANVEGLRKSLPASRHLIIENAEHEDLILSPTTRDAVKAIILSFLKGQVPTGQKIQAPPIKFVAVKD